MEAKLFDSELKVMEVLWAEGDVPARRIAMVLADQVGWSKTTTYTVIKKCVDKGAVQRTEPGFVCRALVSREQARQAETEALIEKHYGGSADLLVASLLGRRALSQKEIEKLKNLVNSLGEEKV